VDRIGRDCSLEMFLQYYKFCVYAVNFLSQLVKGFLVLYLYFISLDVHLEITQKKQVCHQLPGLQPVWTVEVEEATVRVHTVTVPPAPVSLDCS
jgi:hypothetical protein